MREAAACSIEERTEGIHNKASPSKTSAIRAKAGEGSYRSGFIEKGAASLIQSE